MALKELRRPVKKQVAKPVEEKVKKFISKGGTLAEDMHESSDDHRLTLRIPKWLMHKVDSKRKERVGKISRNLWILELINRATK